MQFCNIELKVGGNLQKVANHFFFDTYCNNIISDHIIWHSCMQNIEQLKSHIFLYYIPYWTFFKHWGEVIWLLKRDTVHINCVPYYYFKIKQIICVMTWISSAKISRKEITKTVFVNSKISCTVNWLNPNGRT